MLVTQNVDDLHQRAGSAAILQMHGALNRISCTHCGDEREWTADLSVQMACENCGNTGGLRPAVVWFGEMPRHMERIETALSQADEFVAIGSSGTVYPAAGFASVAHAHGARTLLINLEAAENEAVFDQHCYGPAVELVPQWVNERLSR